MSKPLVSISCITYNHAKYIHQCLEGFLMQKRDFDIEILIHDDAPTDGTQEIIKNYRDKYPDIIKPVFQKENQYSKGIRSFNARFNFPRATGKYIALCDGDDFWNDPLKLKKQIDHLENMPEVVLCSHKVSQVDNAGRLLIKNDIDIEGELITYSSLCMLNTSFRPLTLVFRNLELGYNEQLLKAPHGDVILIALLSRHGRATILNFVGGCYRIHSGGVYSSLHYVKKQINSIKTRKVMIKSTVFDEDQIKELKSQIHIRKWKALKNCLKNGKIGLLFKVLFV